MRAFMFTRIDYIKTKSQLLFIPVYLGLMFVIMLSSDSDLSAVSTVSVFLYMVFIMIVFSTTPFGTCQRQETGFLLLLPATARDRVLGRFLYGFSMMLIAVVCGIIGAAAYRITGHGFSEIDLPVCLIGLAVGMLLMTAEYVFFYLFGESQGQHLLAIVRVLPGMCFFFGTMNLSKEVLMDPDEIKQVVETVGSRLLAIGWISVAGAAAVMLAAVWLCVMMTKKRDN